jgi:ribosomal protein L16/L10AE
VLKTYIKKSGKIFIKTTNIYPVTKKATETRMGKGAGKIFD